MIPPFGFDLFQGFETTSRVFQARFDRDLSFQFLIHLHADKRFIIKNWANRRRRGLLILQREDNHFFFCVNGLSKVRKCLSVIM
jgi:hypothetical protein